jgi:His-Xaa-Ser system protein HxsD
MISPPSEPTELEFFTEVSKTLFSKGAIMRAAHRLTGDCYFEFEELADKIAIRIRHKSTSSARDWKGLFLNELLDEELREKIAKETEAERTLILAHALSKQPVINRELEFAPAFSTPRIESSEQ